MKPVRLESLTYGQSKNVSRLFYPILFTVTAALATTLWLRHGLSTQWLGVFGATVAQAQAPLPSGGPAPPPNGGFAPPPSNGPAAAATTQRLPSAPQTPPAGQPVPGQAGPGQAAAGQAAASRPPAVPSRARQAPYTQLRLESGGLEITQPLPVPSAKVVGRVGNEIIIAADVLPDVQKEFDETARHYPAEHHAMYLQSLMAKHVRQLAQMKLVVHEMKDGVPEDKMPETKKQVMSYFDRTALPSLLEKYKVRTAADLDAKLKEQGSSLAKEKEKFFEQALVSEWLRKQVKYDEHVSHEELLKYYHQHLAEYEFKAKVRFEELRVSYGKKRSRDEAWQVIRGLANRVYAGAPLAELAKTHSEGVKAENGGLYDWTNQGSLSCKEVDAALFSLPVGTLSSVIEDEKGHAFLVVRVVERTDKGVTSFREAQAGIRTKIRHDREQAARAKTLTDFMVKNQFRAWTIYDDMLREMEEKAKKTAKKPGASRIQ